MGALSGSITLRRYRVLGAVPKEWIVKYRDGIRAHALVPIDPAGSEEKSIGWCSMLDATQIDGERVSSEAMQQGRLLLSLRVDTLKPDKAQLKVLLKQRQKEIEAERKEPMSAGALRDLKAILSAELRQKTPPKTRTVDMVWELDASRLYFYSHSKGMNEAFLTLFAQTFNMPLDLEGPSAWARDAAEADPSAEMPELLSMAKPTEELLRGFVGLRPGPRSLDDLKTDAEAA